MELTTVHSEIKAVGDQLQSALQELQIRQHGYAFTDVVPKSAEELFGKGWKIALEGHISAEEVFKFSSKDQLTPIDIMLASVYSDKEHAIKQGKHVTISVTAGDSSYNGTHFVLAVDKHNIVIPVARQGAACGRYQNTEKVDAALAKVSAFQKRLDEINAEINGKFLKEGKEVMHDAQFTIHDENKNQPEAQNTEQATHASTGSATNPQPETHNPKPQTRNLKPVLYGTLAVLGIAGIIFLVVKSNSTSVEQKMAA